jgi:prevent-host-death family protein
VACGIVAGDRASLYNDVQPMTKRMTAAEVRKSWAEVLRAAQRGTPVEVTRNGEPIAAVVSVDQLRRIERETVSDVIARFRARVRPRDLAGPSPWAGARDRATGREPDIE